MLNTKFIEEVVDTYNLESLNELIYEILPRDYNTPALFANIQDIQNLPDKMNVTLFGYVDKFDKKILSGRKAIMSIRSKLFMDGHSVALNWTTSSNKANSMLYGLKMKAPEETLIQVSGKIHSYEMTGGYVYKYINQPILNIIGDNTECGKHVLLPEPIYKLKSDSKLKSLQIQNSFREIFNNFDHINMKDMLPLDIEKELGLPSLRESIQYVHGLRPIPINDFQKFMENDTYRKRILIEKIWRIMYDNFKSINTHNEGNSNYISDTSLEKIKYILSKLKFTLTNDQKKAIWKMLNLFANKSNSKSLVFGDVGSGKTMVSFIVAYVLQQLGEQVVIITPTSILAKQHFNEAKEILGDSVPLEIVHSKTTKKEKLRIQKEINKNKGIILYGTSSLNKLEYENLTAVFVDEEQKFGVHDKEVLQKQYGAHVVYMTATPIPRTLASSMYTDFDIFKIEEKPAMQKPRITKVINKLSESEVLHIKDKLNAGEQILVIVPAISSNDLISSAFAEKKYKELFPEFRLDKINGRMKPNNIEKTTEEFMSGKISILIATTMVDSGFSNKNLSFVFIENAERFGIAQMHQIRGRVGRAEKQGYCFLIPASSQLKEKTQERLNSLVESENGFELSIKDIKLRGSGDIRGLEQSGSEVNLIEWQKEISLMNKFLKGI